MIIFINTILSLALPLIPEYTLIILKCQFVLYLCMIVVDIYKTKQFNLMHTWIAAFLFIIWSDMILTAAEDFNQVYTIPIFFYLIANCLVLWGYKLSRGTKSSDTSIHNIIHPRYFLFFIIVGVLIFIVFYYSKVQTTLTYGRILNDAKGSTTLTGSIVSALGLILPACIAYYFKYISKGGWVYSILLSMPIFILQALIATRFKLLFQIIPFLIVTGFLKVKNNTSKSLIIMAIAMLIIGAYSSYTKEYRNYAANESIIKEQIYASDTQDDIFLTIAQEMSPEGIIRMAYLANDYFEDNNLSYGRESLTIFYFWIPRAWWPDKPTQLDYWLIREYETTSDAHSTSSGFLGELRADFGWFSLFFAIIIGIALKKCDTYIQRIFMLNRHPIQIVFASMLYPYFFFFVRSPLTASINLIFCYIIYIIIKKTMCKPI